MAEALVPKLAKAAESFFASSHFVVVGVSANPDKVGSQVYAWYKKRGLPVVPLQTRFTEAVEGQPMYAYPGLEPPVPLATSLGEIYDDNSSNAGGLFPLVVSNTSISLITPPPVTQAYLETAADLGFRAVWLQPGTFTEEILAWARGTRDSGEPRFEAVVAGDGACVLKHGDAVLQTLAKM